VQWRQQTQRPAKALPEDAGASGPVSSRSAAIGRRLLDVSIGIACLGIPLFFLERGRARRFDIEGGFGLATPGPTLMLAACSCLMVLPLLRRAADGR
jgi:hypothetical protein